MAELAGFPMLSQRDGNINSSADCVPSSIAACLEWLLGQKFSGGEIKDAVYGANYTGGTAASAYVAYCAAHGVKLAPVDGDGAQLVEALHNAIDHQTPALITEPSPYGAGWSHVCAAYKCDTGTITVMDPWIDAPVQKSNDYWAGRLEFHQIWTLEKEDIMIGINDVSTHFKQIDDNHWQSIATGKTLQYGMLANYKTEGNRGLCGWDVLGDVLSNEIELGAPHAPGSVVQFYECGVRMWDAAAGKVSPAKLYDGGVGEDPIIAQLKKQIADLQAQGNNQASAKLDQIKAIVNA